MKKLILVKSCENFFDKQSRFAGWYDVGLSQQGIEKAKEIAQQLKNIKIDYAFMSVLLRAEQTFQTISKDLGYKIRHFKSWKLNERHLGKLQGLNHEKAKKLFGENIVEKVKVDYDYIPPKLDDEDMQNPNKDELYAGLKEQMPLSESIKNVFDRSTEYLTNFVLNTIKQNQTALIIVHKQVLLCIEKYFYDKGIKIVKINDFFVEIELDDLC